MISASATTEQRISGQIGQPAACMIENKGFSLARTGSAGGRIMADAKRRNPRRRPRRDLRSQLSTEAVDKVVRKAGMTA